MHLIVWMIAASIGFVITYALTDWVNAISTLAGVGIVFVTFQITQLFKVAGRGHVSKMGTDWLTQELRRMVWRVLLTLVLAGITFKLTWPEWGMAFWLSVAAYYQVGLALHLREIRQRIPSVENTTNV